MNFLDLAGMLGPPLFGVLGWYVTRPAQPITEPTESELRAKKMVFIQDHYDTLKELDELYPAAKVLTSSE